MTYYFGTLAIQEAFFSLRDFHPVMGIDLLVMKMNNLPIGDSVEFNLITEDSRFLELYFKPISTSKYYARLFSYGKHKSKNWLDKRYPGSGLQSSRTRELSDAFIHEMKTSIWGLSNKYIDIFEKFLPRDENNKIRKFPIISMAIWLYRDEAHLRPLTEFEIIDRFIKQFKINEDELSRLFDTSIPVDLREIDWYSDSPASEEFYLNLLGAPNDIEIDASGFLDYIGIYNVGLVSGLEVDFGERLNLITGDNGLGKTLLLDCSWWAISGDWPSAPGVSLLKDHATPQINFRIAGNPINHGLLNKSSNHWVISNEIRAGAGLSIYYSFDGSVHVYDPEQAFDQLIYMSSNSIWNGFWAGRSLERQVCPGIINDLGHWLTYNTKESKLINQLLSVMSPDDEFKYEIIGKSTLPGDTREIPLITHRLGLVPLIYAPAGIRKILSLAYIIIWAWNRHVAARGDKHKINASKMSILIDEIETHLHPNWQKRIIKSLINIDKFFGDKTKFQFIVSTHSPLVYIGMESHYSRSSDKIFKFEVENAKATINPVLDYVRGNANDALGDIFDAGSGESDASESLKTAIYAIIESDKVDANTAKKITKEMEESISPYDPIWIQWRYFASTKEIKI